MSGWMLAHPWLLVGLVGMSLPVLIHLIGKRRAPTIRFAAFDFLLAINKRLARRERLRQILLLLLRTLAIAAIVFAVARPLRNQQQTIRGENRHLAIILDASASMAYLHQGQTLLERAKSAARDLISHLQPGDSVALVIAGRELRSPFQGPTLDLAAARQAIDAIHEPAGVADLGGGIEHAVQLLGERAGNATFAVVSDLATNSFAHLRPLAFDPAPEVRLIDAAERDTPTALPNLAIEQVTLEPGGESANERVLRLRLRNFGTTAVGRRTLEISLDGRVTQRSFVQLPPLGTSEKSLVQSFPGPGVYQGEVRLLPDTDDGYAADDLAAFVAVIVPGVEVLAINGAPRTTPYEDELFFVERALTLVPKGDPPLRLRLVQSDELRTAADLQLDGVATVLAANPGALPTDVVAALRAYVSGGGGLLFTVGDTLQFEQTNQLWGELLAHPLRDVHRAADPDAGTAPLGIGEVDWEHPVLLSLGQPAEESLRASRTSRYFNLDLGAARARQLLRFDNGAPALLERALGQGRVMLLTTTADVDWSDLCLRSAFPALLQRTVRYLGGGLDGHAAPPVADGGSVELALPTEAAGLALIGPTGQRRELLAVPGGPRRLRFAELTPAGVYRAEVLRSTWQAEPRLDVAVQPSLDESSFVPIAAQTVAEALGGDQRPAVAVLLGTGAGSDPFTARGAASYLLLALLCLFVSESLLASRG